MRKNVLDFCKIPSLKSDILCARMRVIRSYK